MAMRPLMMICFLALTVSALVFAGCPEGEPGPQGDAGEDGERGDPGTDGEDGEDGEDGAAGADGADGQDGEDWEAAQWVGSATCAGCHDDEYQMFTRSGHPYKLVQTAGQVPSLPWPAGNFGEYAPNPPDGYTWADVEYVIGGWGWKQRFVDLDGYIITGTEVQFNIMDDSWVAYHDGEAPGTKPYNCGSCHTSGYDPNGNQGGLPGITGTWEEPGVHCEECHGRGSQHVADPYVVPMQINRDAEMCGSCHYRTDPSIIPASSGFVKHHEQWNEMYSSKKHSMKCIDCHNPHQSARWADATWNPSQSINLGCESCHFQQDATQASATMALMVDCIDCHMPFGAKSALGDLTTFTGDVRSHRFAINADVDADPFNQAGDEANPYVTLDYACNSCHGVVASVKTDQELENVAIGYHSY